MAAKCLFTESSLPLLAYFFHDGHMDNLGEWWYLSVLFASLLLYKHHDQEYLGEEKVCFIFHFQVTVYLQGKPKEKLKARTKAETMEGHSIVACIQAPIHCLSCISQDHLFRAPPTVAWTFLHQLGIQKMSHSHAFRAI